jgi:hypothetical protein
METKLWKPSYENQAMKTKLWKPSYGNQAMENEGVVDQLLPKIGSARLIPRAEEAATLRLS